MSEERENKSSLVKIVPGSGITIRLQLVYGQLGDASHGSPFEPLHRHSIRLIQVGGQPTPTVSLL